jgi:NAD(P)H dehydrogenase (quinone)
MTIAITAASGRLGHAILRELVRQGGGADVVAVARDPARVQVAGITVRAGDYTSRAAMAAAMAGASTVVMISAPVAGGSDRVPLHRNVIAAARDAGVRRVIFTSVIGNGAEAGTGFGPTQQVNRQTEADLREAGLGWVIGRNALYLELDLIQIRRAAEAGVYTNPAGEGRCPYLTIGEIAYAYAQLARDEGQAGRTYNITGENLNQAEIVGLVREIFGLAVRYEAITDDACIEKFRRLMPERGEAVARMLTGCFQAIRCGAFDVPSDYAAAAGRPARSVRAMLEELRDAG